MHSEMNIKIKSIISTQGNINGLHMISRSNQYAFMLFNCFLQNLLIKLGIVFLVCWPEADRKVCEGPGDGGCCHAAT